MNTIGDAAIEYAARGWKIIPLHSIVNGHCTCKRNDCPSPGKHPIAELVPHGHLEATSDRKTLINWWRRRPWANIGLACSLSGLVALDVDPRNGGNDTWKQLLKNYGPELENTTTSLTGGGGRHLIYQAGTTGSFPAAIGPGVEVKHNHLIVLPPSRHLSGKEYQWLIDPDKLAPQRLPAELMEQLARDENRQNAKQRQVRTTLGEVARAAEALEVLDPRRWDRRDEWIELGMALRELGNAGLLLWTLASQNSHKYRPGECQRLWSGFEPKKGNEHRIGLGSLYAKANHDLRGAKDQVAWTKEDAVLDYYGHVKALWSGWIAEGHLTLIAGPQDTGKTWLISYLISLITGRSKEWPDESAYIGKTGPVVMVDTEEMRGVLLQRLKLRHPLGNGEICFPTRDGSPTYLPRLPQDVGLIEDVAQRIGARAILVDSLSGLHSLDENSAEMRSILQELVGLAGRLQIPLVATHHARKKGILEPDRMSLDRVRGSSTITQFCRSVWGVWRTDEKDHTKPIRVEQLKWSFGPSPEPWGFRIVGNGQLEFCEAPDEGNLEPSETYRAMEFLRRTLGDGQPRSAGSIMARARAAGLGKWPLYNARDKLGVKTDPVLGWSWNPDPDTADTDPDTLDF